MRNDNENPNKHSLPPYLGELLRPTPSGVAKLIAAWDGLSVETQILLLDRLADVGMEDAIRAKAMESPNAYVRYLAARDFCFVEEIDKEDEDKKSLKKRIEEDADPLVRYSTLEGNGVGSFFLMKDYTGPDSFFLLPHEARLAKVRLLTGCGQSMAELISYALDHQFKEGKVSEIELCEILLDYLAKPEFKQAYLYDARSYDGYGEYGKGEAIAALWELLPKVPEGVSYVLIQNLPEDAGLKSGIPEKIVGSLTDRQLEILLWRNDIRLLGLRKKLFFECTTEREDLQGAAVSRNFDLTYEEFAQVLAKPEEEKARLLRTVALFAHDLSLWLLDAIHDVLSEAHWSNDVDRFGTIGEKAEWAERSFEDKLEQLKDYERDKQVREWRLYKLAKKAVPWKQGEQGYPPSGDLEFLAKHIVAGDTWGTFIAFSDAWAKNYWELKRKRLDRDLQRACPLEEEHWRNEEDETEPDESESMKKPLTRGDFILYNVQKWAEIWLWVCFVFVVIILVFAGSAVYKLFMGEYGSALKSGFIAVVGLVMFKGARRQYSDLREEQKRIMDEMLE